MAAAEKPSIYTGVRMLEACEKAPLCATFRAHDWSRNAVRVVPHVEFGSRVRKFVSPVAGVENPRALLSSPKSCRYDMTGLFTIQEAACGRGGSWACKTLIAQTDRGVCLGNPGRCLGNPGRCLDTQGVASDTQGVASDTQGVASDTQGVASDTQVPVASETQGVASETQGVASETQGVASETQGVASETQGVASETQGVASETQGVCLGNPGRCFGHPGRCPGLCCFGLSGRGRECKSTARTTMAHWLWDANGPRFSTMLPPPCPRALRARRKVLPWAEKRDSEGAVVF